MLALCMLRLLSFFPPTTIFSFVRHPVLFWIALSLPIYLAHPDYPASLLML